MKAKYLNTHPYQGDAMTLPVADVAKAIGFYTSIMGFEVVSSETVDGIASVVLGRDDIKIGLAENGGDPTQDGCFFGVDDIEAAFDELKSNGWEKEDADFRIDKYGDNSFRVFFVVAPDGLCYCLGQKV